MDRIRNSQVHARAEGFRRTRTITRWSAIGAVALAALFGGVFAQARGSAAQAGDQSGQSNGQSNEHSQESDDRQENGATPGVTPSTQAPRGGFFNFGGGGHARSGGS